MWGSLHYSEWLAVYDGLRVAAAKLVNGEASEIALVKNTSEGIATIAMGLDWKPGDRMVGRRHGFAQDGERKRGPRGRQEFRGAFHGGLERREARPQCVVEARDALLGGSARDHLAHELRDEERMSGRFRGDRDLAGRDLAVPRSGGLARLA